MAAWVSPRTWAVERITPAKLQEYSDSLNVFDDAFPAYGTPGTLWTAATSNPSIGNGSCTGRYAAAGKWIAGSISIVFGSTTTVGTGNYIFLLPVSAQNFRCLTGTAELLDSSASTPYPRVVLGTTATTFAVADFTPTRLSSTGPIAWATGDRIDIGFFYEAA